MSLIDRTDERRCYVDCGQENCPCKTRISRAQIEEAIKYVYDNNPRPKQRKVIAITGCSTYGSIYVGNYCKSPNCKNCRERQANFLRLMQEEVQKQIKDLENGE